MSALSTSSAKRQASTTKQYPDSKLKQTDSTENRTGETNAESIPYSIIPTLLVAVRYGNMGCGVFKRGEGTKLERCLPKNQHTQRKLLNLRVGLMGRCQKLSIILVSKVI